MNLLNKLSLARTHPFRNNRVFSSPEVVAALLARLPVDYPRIPCVVPSWLNTARRTASTPKAHGFRLRSVLADRPTLKRLPEPIVFINAWNEWAEGNHHEPDLQFGHRYLEETDSPITQS